MHSNPNPFPQDPSYLGHEPAPATPRMPWWQEILYTVVGLIVWVLAVVTVGLLGTVLLVCSGPIVLCVGGVLYMFFRGDKDAGVE